jgi:hypothetical protein
MTHTPGPWTYHADGEANHYTLMRSDGGWLISFLHNGEQWTLTQEANARLMAAAPEMLEALKNLENDDGSTMPPSAWKLVQDAIAKAEGQP